jgi:hypothetical protein
LISKGTVLGNRTNFRDAQANGVATIRKAANAFSANVSSSKCGLLDVGLMIV